MYYYSDGKAGMLQSSNLSLTVTGVVIAVTAGVLQILKAVLITLCNNLMSASPTLFRHLYPRLLPNTR